MEKPLYHHQQRLGKKTGKRSTALQYPINGMRLKHAMDQEIAMYESLRTKQSKLLRIGRRRQVGHSWCLFDVGFCGFHGFVFVVSWLVSGRVRHVGVVDATKDCSCCVLSFVSF